MRSRLCPSPSDNRSQPEALVCGNRTNTGIGPIAANNGPQVSKPPDPILKFDKCATKVRSQAKKDKWTITIIQQLSFSDLLAACGFTGPDAPACVGIVGGASGTVSLVNWAGYVNSVWDGETKCLEEN